MNATGTKALLDRLSLKNLPVDLPPVDPVDSLSQRFSAWLEAQPVDIRKTCNLDQQPPPEGVHFIAGETGIFYDFRNTDIVIDEFYSNKIDLKGKLLDFGCSSGRNLATLQEVYQSDLILFGVDPVPSSIAWARQAMPEVSFSVNQQMPPLNMESNTLDFVIAKSVWTHFGATAAAAWFKEIARVLRPGGYFFFSTHGPHDIASRIVHNFPNPRYERFDGHQKWNKGLFLTEAIKRLDHNGFAFFPYKSVSHQGDVGQIVDGSTAQWGLTFVLRNFLESELLPSDLRVVSRSICRTGHRHDAYIVQKTYDA